MILFECATSLKSCPRDQGPFSRRKLDPQSFDRKRCVINYSVSFGLIMVRSWSPKMLMAATVASNMMPGKKVIQ